MKKYAVNTYLVSILAVSSVMSACGSSKSGGGTVSPPVSKNSETPVPVTPPSGSGQGGSGNGGGVASRGGISFKPVSWSEFNNYVNGYKNLHPLNSPSDARIQVNLHNDGTKRFFGEIKISYYDNGILYQGVFKSENTKNVDIYKLNHPGLSDSQYNHWFIYGNQKYFSGFFDDPYGAIVLVINNVHNQNDGQGGSPLFSGEIWYRNYMPSYAPQSPYRSCWFVTLGPYDCRSNSVIYKTSPYPSDSYRKLGSFTGYPYGEAFD